MHIHMYLILKCLIKQIEHVLRKVKEVLHIQEPVVDTINIESFRRIVYRMLERYPNEDEIELFYTHTKETFSNVAPTCTNNQAPSLID